MPNVIYYYFLYPNEIKIIFTVTDFRDHTVQAKQIACVRAVNERRYTVTNFSWISTAMRSRHRYFIWTFFTSELSIHGQLSYSRPPTNREHCATYRLAMELLIFFNQKFPARKGEVKAVIQSSPITVFIASFMRKYLPRIEFSFLK